MRPLAADALTIEGLQQLDSADLQNASDYIRLQKSFSEFTAKLVLDGSSASLLSLFLGEENIFFFGF